MKLYRFKLDLKILRFNCINRIGSTRPLFNVTRVTQQLVDMAEVVRDMVDTDQVTVVF